MKVISTLDADGGALSVNIVNLEIILADVASPGVIDEEPVFLLSELIVEGSKFGDSVEEDDDLWFGLYLSKSLKDPENYCIFICTFGIEMADSLKTLVLIITVELYDVVAG